MADPLFDQMIQRAVDEHVATNPEVPEAPPKKKDKMIGAHLAWLGPAAADIATTLYGQKPELGLEESNPLVKWAPKKAQVPLGAGMEAAAYYLGRRFLKDKHPKWFKAALFGAGALHGKAALSNLSEIFNAKQDLKDKGLDGLKYKDGYYYDPSAFVDGK